MKKLKSYHSNIKTLCFLEKLYSTMDFALQLGNQATNRFHFLHIDTQISSLNSISMKCGMCQVFTLRLTMLTFTTEKSSHTFQAILRNTFCFAVTRLLFT